MKTRVIAAFCGLVIAAILHGISPAFAESLSGRVFNHAHQPIPGLTVFLVSAKVGRSSPAVTDGTGYYTFSNVPSISGDYYLEIYWGHSLIYRRAVPVHGEVNHDIMLNP